MPDSILEAADQASQAALQHFDDRAFAAAAPVHAGDAGQHAVAMHGLAHLERRQEQVVAAAASGRRKPKPSGLAITVPAIRSRRSAAAYSPRRFSSNWPSRTIAARRLLSASDRSGAVSSSCVGERVRRERSFGEAAQDQFAAGDRLLVTAGFALGVRIVEAAPLHALAGCLRTRRLTLSGSRRLRHEAARRGFRHPCRPRGAALGSARALLGARLHCHSRTDRPGDRKTCRWALGPMNRGHPYSSFSWRNGRTSP